MTTLEKLLVIFPDKPWNFNRLSCNPGITSDFVDRHLDKPWNIYGLCINPSITPEFIDSHIDKSWDWYALSKRMTPKFIDCHLDKPWHWGKYGLSNNPNVTLAFIDSHLDKPWHWGKGGLSTNRNVTPEFIEKHITKPWYWGYDGLSQNLKVTRKFVDALATRKQSEGEHSKKARSTLAKIAKYMHDAKSFGTITVHSSFSQSVDDLEFIEENLDMYWNWGKEGLSSNPNVTLEFIKAHSDKPWDLSYNPNLTVDFIRQHLDEIEWIPLSSNSLNGVKTFTFLDELEHTWYMPPGASDIPVFSKGGRIFHEGMNEAMQLSALAHSL